MSDAVVRHYARVTEGLPPMPPPYNGHATLQDAYIAHRTFAGDLFERHLHACAPGASGPAS